MRASNYDEKEKAICDYITGTIRKYGYSPTVRDIKDALGIKSTSTVHGYLTRLAEKGLITKQDGKSRTISTGTETSGKPNGVPLIGRVRAGMPILAAENYEGYIDYPVKNGEELFALRVTGDSMIEAGILDGDVIIVRKGNFCENGDIAVALIDDGATVKTFYRENGHFRLQPENKKLKPIITDEVLILGKVIADLRFYE